MNSIAKRIVEAANAYYVDNNPIMSDEDFDKLVDSLREASPNHPILTTTAWGASSRDWYVPHWHPMTGLDQIKYGDVGENVGQEILGITAKLDGLSGTCRYMDGILVDVLTRGDGETGKDITANALATGHIPKTIRWSDGKVEVRGEFVLSYDNHKKMVEKELAREDTNLRNVAAGAMNSDDPEKAAYVSFIAFEVIGDGLELYDVADDFQIVSEYTTGIVDQLNNAWQCCSPYSGRGYPYPTDGLVIDTDTGKYKVKFDDLPTGDVTVTVTMHTTRTGRVIPHATFDAVYIDGSWIEACTLNNIEWCRTAFKTHSVIDIVGNCDLVKDHKDQVRVRPGEIEFLLLDSDTDWSLFDYFQNGRKLELVYDTHGECYVIRGIEPTYLPIWTGAKVRIRKANQIIPEIIEVLESVPVPSNEDIAYELGLENWYATDSDIIDREARYAESTVIGNFIESCMPKGSGSMVYDQVLIQMGQPDILEDFFNTLTSYGKHWSLPEGIPGFGEHRMNLLHQTIETLKTCKWTHYDVLINLSIPGYGDANCQWLLDEFNYDLGKIREYLISKDELRKASQLRRIKDLLGERIYTDLDALHAQKDIPEPTGRVKYSMTGKINGYTKSAFDELVDAVWDDGDYEIMVTDSDRVSAKMQAALDNGKKIMSSADFLLEYAK